MMKVRKCSGDNCAEVDADAMTQHRWRRKALRSIAVCGTSRRWLPRRCTCGCGLQVSRRVVPCVSCDNLSTSTTFTSNVGRLQARRTNPHMEMHNTTHTPHATLVANLFPCESLLRTLRRSALRACPPCGAWQTCKTEQRQLRRPGRFGCPLIGTCCSGCLVLCRPLFACGVLGAIMPVRGFRCRLRGIGPGCSC